MVSVFSSQSRIFMIAALAMVSLLWSATVHAEEAKPLPAYVIEQFGTPPPVPTGPLSDGLKGAVQAAFIDSMTESNWGVEQSIALTQIAESEDPRLAWIISDLMRFITERGLNVELARAAGTLLQKDLGPNNHWGGVTDHLIAWNIPAPPDYLTAKRAIFTSLVPGWDKIFVEGDIDWRHVSWGGVLIDDRAYDTTDEQCNCIPAADNPAVTSAAEATWLEDDDIVFGVVVNGEARAYPRQIMEVREMVNDTLGGRDILSLIHI